jgi:Zn finger protein HypA/HybF involved in hydrogenase expression
MICENCFNEHNCEYKGKYTSGRFCSQRCSRSYSGKKSPPRLVSVETKDVHFYTVVIKADWNTLSLPKKKMVILHEQNYVCKCCKINLWRGRRIILEFHHIDGNNKNNSRENLEYLCPICHSQTENFRFKGRKHINHGVK